MALTSSTMPSLGTAAPDFKLPDSGGKFVALKDFDSKPALLVAFISLHCPYTKHIFSEFISLVHDYDPEGLAVVAINSNDPGQHDEDRPEKIAQAVKKLNCPFPVLIDATQQVAKNYKAACTPDFFLYDKTRRLVYRGRFDDSRPDNKIAISGDQLRAAIEAVLAGEAPAKTQKPSVGCNIKWKRGNEPDYFAKKQEEHA